MKTNTRKSKNSGEIHVKITPVGPSQETLSKIGQHVTSLPALRKMIGNAHVRLLHVRALDEHDEVKPTRPVSPTRFRATFYDYTNGRVIHAEGSLSQPKKITLSEHGYSPLPTEEEFQAAVNLIRKEKSF